MPAGRPKKYLNREDIEISIDAKDKSYLDDHRGKLSRGEYLIESMYALKGDTRIKEALTLVQELKKENYELKRQLLFEQSKNKPVKIETSPEILQSREKWWNEKSINIRESYNKRTEPNWDKMFITAQTYYKDTFWNDKSEIKQFVEQKLKTI